MLEVPEKVGHPTYFWITAEQLFLFFMSPENSRTQPDGPAMLVHCTFCPRSNQPLPPRHQIQHRHDSSLKPYKANLTQPLQSARHRV